MQKLATIVVLLSLTLFLGCGTQKRVVVAPQKSLPSWYTSPPLSSTSELYALGEGRDKSEAIANALNMMVSTLSVSLSSDFSAKTVVKEGQINRVDAEYINDVRSSVKEIRISNYELLNAEPLGFKKYAVLLKANKKKLFESMLHESEQEFTLLDTKEKNLQNANGLKKLAFYKEATKSLRNLPNRLIVMSALESGFDGLSYLKKMQSFETKYEEILKNLTFFVTTSKNARSLQAVIEKGLAKDKINIAKKGTTKMHFDTYIVAKIQRADAYGFTLARSEIEFVTKDGQGRVVGSNRFNLVGQSSQGYEVAKQNLALRLDELVQKEGIASVLGLDI